MSFITITSLGVKFRNQLINSDWWWVGSAGVFSEKLTLVDA
jgi:hypothetical protein